MLTAGIDPPTPMETAGTPHVLDMAESMSREAGESTFPAKPSVRPPGKNLTSGVRGQCDRRGVDADDRQGGFGPQPGRDAAGPGQRDAGPHPGVGPKHGFGQRRPKLVRGGQPRDGDAPVVVMERGQQPREGGDRVHQRAAVGSRMQCMVKDPDFDGSQDQSTQAGRRQPTPWRCSHISRRANCHRTLLFTGVRWLLGSASSPSM